MRHLQGRSLQRCRCPLVDQDDALRCFEFSPFVPQIPWNEIEHAVESEHTGLEKRAPSHRAEHLDYSGPPGYQAADQGRYRASRVLTDP